MQRGNSSAFYTFSSSSFQSHNQHNFYFPLITRIFFVKIVFLYYYKVKTRLKIEKEPKQCEKDKLQQDGS